MRARPRPRSAIAAAMMALTGLITGAAATAPLPAAAADHQAFTQGFEGGTLPDGWRVTSGSFGQLISNRAKFHNDDRDYLKEGSWFLSTLETPTQTADDGYTGTVVSAPFTLTRPTVTMLVGGGAGAGTYVALCAYDASAPDGCGTELDRASGGNAEPMIYRALDGSAHLGKQVVLKIVDTSTGGWGHITVDGIRANVPPAATAPRATRTKKAAELSWQPAPDPAISGYAVYRSTTTDTGYERIGTSNTTTYRDTTADADTTYFYRIAAVDADGGEAEPVTTMSRPYQDLYAPGKPVTYQGETLGDTRFAVGPLGSAGIVQDGTGARPTWWIFNNIGELNANGWHNKPDTYTKGKLPNSFFAVRAQQTGEEPVVRALQTTPVGAFPAMKSLTFQGEYPLAGYDFQDEALPVKVSEDILNPMIPGNTKDSAIPTAIYRFTLTNPGKKPATVSLLASQQNAAGFNGYDTIGGDNDRVVDGYGSNRTDVAVTEGRRPQVALRMSGATGAGTMNLTAYGNQISATASWDSLTTLKDDLAADGELTGASTASSPAAKTTVDGALAVKVTLQPGESKTVPVTLNWHFPGAKNPNGGDGRQYENWWADADDVAGYVTRHYDRLLGDTQAYHDSLYDTNMPRYLIDRVSAATAVLHAPTVWWAKNGFFGAREGWGCCPGMPTHVFHYAQAQAWLWPEVGRRWTQQWLDNADAAGKIPMRFNGDSSFTMDGQTGVVLSAYRTYQTTDRAWLDANWATVKKVTDYVIAAGDKDHDGILTGSFNTTLDGGETGNGSWLGSMYLASVHAAQEMAEAEGDSASAELYASIYEKGRVTGEKLWFNGEYYTEVHSTEGASYGNGSEIDMLLGQWWSTQLGLGDIFDPAHMSTAAKNLFTNNYKDNLLGDTPYSGYNFAHKFRQYALETDAGLQMITWPHDDQPANTPLYYDELMSGFEYSAAGVMLQRGQLDEGLRLVKAISDRYDGRARKGPYIGMSTCETGDGTGSPFGDDECGKYYGRTLASWSLLTALQGYTWNAPEAAMSFAPTWKPGNHRSFFSVGDAWGTFTQQQTGNLRQTDTLQVRHGGMTLRTLRLQVPEGTGTVHLKDVIRHSPLHGAELTRRGDTVTITLAEPVRLSKGDKLTVRLEA